MRRLSQSVWILTTIDSFETRDVQRETGEFQAIENGTTHFCLGEEGTFVRVCRRIFVSRCFPISPRVKGKSLQIILYTRL